ncbi:MAG: ATP-binding protein [Polyangiaceae bacterium]
MGADDLDFRLLFEGSPDVLLVLLPDAPRYTMVAATDARLRVTHTTREQTMGRGLFELFPDNPDDPAATGAANLRRSLERVLATRAPDTMAVQKYDIRGPDGTFEVKYWSPRNLPVLSPSGEILYILHRVEDVSELVRASEMGEELRGRTREMESEVLARSRELAEANQGLRDANAKLGELDAAKTAFFSNVSHEFRTPLTLMLGPLEDALADRGAGLAPSQKARLELVHGNAMRLLKLVNTLLDFSRLEAGRMEATYAPVDLSALTAELAGMFQSAFDRSGVKLVVDCPPLSEPAFVDRDMWEKIVPNLVSNAFKFTLEGQVVVRVREQPAQIRVEVADTGRGIPASELPRVFERFHRIPGGAARTHEGSGIGLSLVRALVELHGGRISVDSLPGEGTTFRVEIPKGSAHLPVDRVSEKPVVRTAERAAAAHAVEASRWARGSADDERPAKPGQRPGQGARPRVLVVDDNADLRGYLVELLAPAYEVAATSDGLEALDSVREWQPEIVISDVMMPRLDGFGLLRRLRADPASASLPVILLSARAGEEAAIEGLDAGSDDYLVKPFSARELLARVRTHIGLARARRAWILELERANRELEAFSYAVSHDLRAPLRVISGYARFLEEDCAATLDDAGREHLGRIQGGVRRMNTLIESLLALSRIARAPLSRELVDVSALAQEIVQELRREHPTRDAAFTIEPGLAASADRALLSVVLTNLVGNAFKYSSRREGARIEVGRLGAGEPTFFVRDDGAGFDMAYAGRLFTPFQRLHDAREFEGTGVGLATVQRIVHRHGGRIWAEGAPDRGATFFFTLPASNTLAA